MSLTHHLTRLVARDPHQAHRAATPLELLFDLTFVVAFSQASSQAAHLFELGHTANAVVAFAIAVFAVSWAWINYSWLASAYDNDDVFFRLATFVQMIGVIILALGIPPFFHSIDEGHHVDNAIVIAGYVIMRLALIAIWIRVTVQNPSQRRLALTYAAGVGAVQIGWIIALVIDPPLWAGLGLMVLLAGLEMVVPVVAERFSGGSPWNAHHIAERYGLLVIITLGEVVLGTVLAISAVVEEQGWSPEAALIAFGGLLVAFCMWWVYFTVPAARVLSRHRGRAFAWGYLHVALFGSVAAVGAGLHTAAYVITGAAHVDATYALLTVAVPVLIFSILVGAMYNLLMRRFDGLFLVKVIVVAVILAAAVAASAQGVSLGVTIVIVALAPAFMVLAYESRGHRRTAADLARLGA